MMLTPKLQDFVRQTEARQGSNLESGLLTFLERFNNYCSLFGYSANEETLHEEALRIYFFHALQLGIDLSQKKEWVDVLMDYVTFLYEGKLPFPRQNLAYFQAKIQFVTIQNPMDHMLFFKNWDKHSFSRQGGISKGLIPTRDDGIIMIKEIEGHTGYQVYKFSNQVYFYQGQLIPAPPSDILVYDQNWNLSSEHVHMLNHESMTFFLFFYGEGDQKYNCRLVHKSQYQLLHHQLTRIIENIEFCISLKAFEQYYLDCSQDEFYQLILDEMDQWIVRMKTEPAPELLQGAQNFFEKLQKLARQVYRQDKVFHNYLREIETCLELSKLKNMDSKNSSPTRLEAFSDNLSPKRRELEETSLNSLGKSVTNELKREAAHFSGISQQSVDPQNLRTREEKIRYHLEEAQRRKSRQFESDA